MYWKLTFILWMFCVSAIAAAPSTTNTLKSVNPEVVKIETQQKMIAKEYDSLMKSLDQGQKKALWLLGQFDGLETLKKTYQTTGTVSAKEVKK